MSLVAPTQTEQVEALDLNQIEALLRTSEHYVADVAAATGSESESGKPRKERVRRSQRRGVATPNILQFPATPGFQQRQVVIEKRQVGSDHRAFRHMLLLEAMNGTFS